MGKEKNNHTHSLGHEVGLGITLLRGLLLVALGLSLLVIPDKTHSVLYNMIGMFWLTTGIVLIRQEAHRKGNRVLLTLAIVGVAAGVLVLTRDLSRQWLAEVWVRGLLGGVILLTGVLHATSRLRLGREALRGRPFVNVLLGLVEIFLGGLLLLAPASSVQILYKGVMIWALLAGGLLLGRTVLQWLRERRQEQTEEQT